MQSTTKRTTPETADPAAEPIAKRQRKGRVQHHVRVPGRPVPPSNPETIMWSQMHAIGLRSPHVERLINKHFLTKGETELINNIAARCTRRHIYPSGYEFGLLVHVAERFVSTIPVEEPEEDAPADEKKRYLVKLGFPATFVDALFQILPAMHIARSDPIDLAYDFAYVGARLHCMELEGQIRRGWLNDAIEQPSLFSQFDHRALADVALIYN